MKVTSKFENIFKAWKSNAYVFSNGISTFVGYLMPKPYL